MKQSNTENQMAEFTGKFSKWIFHPENSSYCIGLYHSKQHGSATLVGDNLPDCSYPVTFRGQWVQNKNYGQQFRVEMVLNQLPEEKQHIEQFIVAQKIGIGPKRARQMLELVGIDQFWDALESDPLQFCSIKGIVEKAVISLQSKAAQLSTQRELFRFFSNSLPLTARQYKRICEVFDNSLEDALQQIMDNPFVLMPCGYGFSELDRFASEKTVFPVNDSRRLLAATQQALLDARSSSHSGLPLEVLQAEIGKLLTPMGRVSKEDIEAFLYEATAHGSVIFSGNLYYLPRSYKEECYIAESLVSLATKEEAKSVKQSDFESAMAKYEAQKGFCLSADQRKAVWTALNRCICIITGGPGSGKSTILDAVLYCWKTFFDDNWILMAPTGKASVRMTETTHQPATTIHSSLGLSVGSEQMEDIDYHTSHLHSALVVVDESSMIDQTVMTSVMLSLSEGGSNGIQHLVMVGDPEQLPSVGWGNVLADMIQSEVIPVCRLTTIYRQGSDNPIITNSQKMRNGDINLDWSNRSFRRYHCGNDEVNAEKACQFYARCVQQFGIEEVVLLSPYHRRKTISSDALNQRLQNIMNPDSGQGKVSAAGKEFRNGDRVMQLKNTDTLSNGDVGTVIATYPRAAESEPCLVVDYGKDAYGKSVQVEYIREELVQLELAYAMSVHKSQGSQYKTVIIILPVLFTSFLRRNVLYTAITRSSMNVAIFSPTDTISRCILNDKQDMRYTNLAVRLRAIHEKITMKAAS